MNVVKIYGGLGNQLFQYAFGKCMSLKGIEVSYYTPFKKIHKKEPFRRYLLDKFNVQIEKGILLNQRTFRDMDYTPDMIEMNNCNFFGYWQHLDLYKKILLVLRK